MASRYLSIPVEDDWDCDIKSRLATAVGDLNFEVCQRLVTDKNANIRLDDGSSLLHILANKYFKKKTNADKILKLLLRKGAKVSARDKEGNTPLHIAAKEGHCELCRKLIDYQKERGSELELNILNSKKMTPLHLAAQLGREKVIDLFLKEEADPKLLDCKKYLPLHYAASIGNPQCCELLRHTYPRGMPGDESPLVLAVKKGHYWCCEKMKLTQEDIDYQDKQGNTALHLAAKKGFKKLVEKLIELGASLDIENNDGNTPLMDAVIKHATGCLEVLVKAKANLGIINKQKKGVLHLAAEKKADDCLDILLKDAGVRKTIDRKDKDGCTAFIIAVKKDCERCSLMLLDEGASPNVECNRRLTPLHYATENATTTSIWQKIWKIKDLNVNITDRELEQAPLHLAAKRGLRDICLKLLNRGAYIDAVDSYRRTALSISAYEGHSLVVKLLIKRGANKRNLDVKRSTPLHAAAAKGNQVCCKVLTDADKQLCFTQNEKGKFPLDEAFLKGKHDVFEFFLQSISFQTTCKLPRDIVKNMHFNTHKALKEGNRTSLEAIIRSSWWEAGFGFNAMAIHEQNACDNFRQLVKQYPDLAKHVLDHCISRPRPPSRFPSYCFRILDDNYFIEVDKISENKKTSSTNSKRTVVDAVEEEERDPFDPTTRRLKPSAKECVKSPLQSREELPVNIMSKYKRLHLLEHPLTKAWLSYKWKAYVKYIFVSLLILQITFIGSLAGFMSSAFNWQQISKIYNVSNEDFCGIILNSSGYTSISKTDVAKLNSIFYDNGMIWQTVILSILMAMMCCVETNKMLKLRKYYLCGLLNLLRVMSLILTLLLLLPYPSCGALSCIKPEFVWECGIMAFMLSCICLIGFLNRLPSLSFFASVTHSIKTYMKGFFFITIFVVSFAFIFHMLLIHDHKMFHNFPQATMKTVVWMLGDLAYDESFLEGRLSYPILANFLFLIFIFTVGIFVFSLIKAPTSSAQKLALYRAQNHVDMILTFDVCYPSFRRKYAISSKCSNETKQSKMVSKFEDILHRRSRCSFISRKLVHSTNSMVLMNVTDFKRPHLSERIESIKKFFNIDTDEDDNITLPDQMHEKLDEQNTKLDQLLTLCKQLKESHQLHNEQMMDMKQNNQMQNEQILELKQQLNSLRSSSQ